jgi:tricorn protease-like protein
VASLDSAERTLLFENAQSTNAVFSEGYLLFLRERTLMAQPFDLGRLKLTGEPTPIAEGIQTVGTGQNGHFAASDDGVLIYQTGASGSDSQLTWFDRTGKAVATAGDRAGYRDVELSPDGTRAAVSMSTESQTRYDIWLVDLLRGGIRTRLTSDPANEIAPAWAPDGSRIVFSSNRDGNYDLFWIASSGVGLEEAILTADGNQYSYGWFHDGRQLIYQTPGETAASFDLWVLPLAGDRTPVPFLQNPTRKVRARFSPDGRWVAYESDESGRSEVYVVPFPKAEGKELVSTAGGTYARWRRDGKEIFYMAPDNRLMAAEVIGEGPVFRVGAVRPLFAINPPSGRYPYDVSADGQRFLVNTSSEVDAASTQPITVVLNWPAALRR